MNISDILTHGRIVYSADASSKKRALELLCTRLADHQENITSSDVFDSLLSRERLSSTGLGKGVALPHGRLKSIDRTLCAFIQLRDGIDFDSNDQQPVDLLCALVVPEKSTDEHLRVLAMLAEMFRDKVLCELLRKSSSSEELYMHLTHWQPSSHPSFERDPDDITASVTDILDQDNRQLS